MPQLDSRRGHPQLPEVLQGDVIHLWRIRLDESEWGTVPVEKFLTPQEIAQGNRFVVPGPAVQYIRSHIALRWVLSRYLAHPPNEIELRPGEFGKPFVPDADGFEFNLSQSGIWALVAVSDRPVGVDVETHRPNVRMRSLASRYFSAAEAEFVLDAGESEQAEVFYQVWTRKEACIKAWGTGLRTPLDSFDVLPGESVQVPYRGETWTVESVPATPGSVSAALCTQGTEVRWITLDLGAGEVLSPAA